MPTRFPCADGSVDLIVTRPPQGQAGDERPMSDRLAHLWEVMHESWRVLAPHGVVCMALGDGRSAGRSLAGIPWRFALGCVNGEADPDGIGWVLVNDLIWHKEGTDTHEYVFVFAKNSEHYGDGYAAAEPYCSRPRRRLTARVDRAARQAYGGANGGPALSDEVGVDWGNGMGRVPGDVLCAPDSDDGLPTALVEMLVKIFSPESVCLACNEPRRRVLGRACKACGSFCRKQRTICPGCGHRRDRLAEGSAATVTTWACGCEDTSAPTRPGRVLDPLAGSGPVPAVADSLGRVGLGGDPSGEGGSTGRREGPVAVRSATVEQATLWEEVTAC